MPDQVPALFSRTGRVKLVKLAEENDGSVSVLRSHPQTRKYLRFFPEKFSVEDARKLRERREADPGYHDFNVLRIDDEEEEDGSRRFIFIGTAGVFHLNEEHRTCEVGILMSPEVHRGGYATDVLYTLFGYAFEGLGMHRVGMKTERANEGMRGWCERVGGMRLESEERGMWVDPVNGGYSDVVGYGMVEEEWRERVKGALEKRLGLVD